MAMSIFRAGLPVGLGLVVMWGLQRLGAWRTRAQTGSEPALQPPRDGAQDTAQDTADLPSPSRLSPAPPGPAEAGSAGIGESPPATVRVVGQGHAGWARQRQAQVKAALGEETYRTLEALMRWCWG